MSARPGVWALERRAEILRDWNANKLGYGEALRLLVQEGGMSVDGAARALAGDRP